MQRGQASRSVFVDFEPLMEAGMVDEPGRGSLDALPAARQCRVEARRVFGKRLGLLWRENRVHEEAAAAMAVEVRTVIAVLLGLRFKSDIDQIRLLGALHGRRRIAMRVFQHAFSRTHLQHRVADVRGVHAIAHGDVQRLGELTVTDHARIAVPQRERDRQHHVSRRREKFRGRSRRSAVHAGFQRAHAVAEGELIVAQRLYRTFLAVPNLDAVDAGGDLLTVRADVLHDRRADGAGNAGQAFNAFQSGLRAALGLFVNLRPAQMHKALADACPIKPEIIGDGFDILVCRELTGDVYFGKHYRRESDKGWGETGADDMNYSVYEVERIGRRAFEMAMKRSKKVCSVDKANVLETSRVWRETMHRIKDEYPEVEYTDMYVDNCAMQLVRNPGQFDVIVTGNLFGDILSDEASMITGSIGMLPSASMNESGKGMYEPIHGSAPDIAGKGIANPIATILSCAMMLRYSFGLKAEADAIETAVENVLNAGHRTADIAAKGEKVLSTSEMGTLIREQL